jgi:type VI secretion system secreted protein Hcp
VGACDYFLSFKGPDVKGESLDKTFNGMIEVLSFAWSEENRGTAGTGGGAGAGKVVRQDLSISKYVDKASNALFQACATGMHYNTATLYCRKPGGDPLVYLEFEMSGVVYVSAYNVAGNGGEVVPTEHITINFQKLMMTYNQQAMTGGGSGPAKLGYDYGQSTKL